MKEQHDRLQSRRRSLSPPLFDREHSSGPARGLFGFSEKHRLLELRLKPLIRIQRDFEGYLGPAFEPDEIETAFHTTFPSPDVEPSRFSRRHPGFSTSTNSPWKTCLSSPEEPRRFAEKKYTQDLRDIIGVLCCCGSDIKQLWADDVVQHVLKGAGPLSEHATL